MSYVFTHVEGKTIPGSLVYVRKEYSFQMGLGGAVVRESSLLVGDLEMFLDLPSQVVTGIGGLHPYPSWSTGSVAAPNALDGSLTVARSDGDPFQFGVSERYVTVGEEGEWATTLDGATGWLTISMPNKPASVELVRIAHDVVAGLSAGALVGLWLRPRFI